MNNDSIELMPADKETLHILQERAKALARPPASTEGEGFEHLLVFPLGEERYGVPVAAVQLTAPLIEQMLARVPCTPDFIFGAVNIRGRIYSVMDIGRYFGLPPRTQPEKAHLLLVSSEESLLGGEVMEIALLIDDLPKVAAVPLNDIKPPGSETSNRFQEYVRGVTSENLVILDLERFLATPGIIVNQET
jgi:purine-binding chemotaxis protein CheW